MDFPDEDLPDALSARTREPLARLRDELAEASTNRRGEQLREGLRIALVGPPNAGKSSLLNALLGREMAIVTPIAGTTRDVLEGRLVLAGAPAILADTAGLRETTDVVEVEGVRRARAWAEEADLRLWVIDGAAPPEQRMSVGPSDWLIINKRDLAPIGSRTAGGLSLSALDAGDVADLRASLEDWAAEKLAGAEQPAATRQRHRVALAEAAASLDRALDARGGPEIVAEDVRLAARALERLSGRIEAEQVLDRVFSSFCIGK